MQNNYCGDLKASSPFSFVFYVHSEMHTSHFTLNYLGPGCFVDPNARQKTGVKKVFTRLKPAPPLTSVQSQPVHYQERTNNSLHNIDYITQYAMNKDLFSEFCEVENLAELSQKPEIFPKRTCHDEKNSPPRKKHHLAMTSKNAQNKDQLYFHFTLQTLGNFVIGTFNKVNHTIDSLSSGNNQKTPS
jgi:hypothetical protein